MINSSSSPRTPGPRSRPRRPRRPERTSGCADALLGLLLLMVLGAFFLSGAFSAAMESWARSYDGQQGQEAIRRIRQDQANEIGYLMLAALGLGAVALWARRPWTAGLMVFGTFAFVVLLGVIRHGTS